MNLDPGKRLDFLYYLIGASVLIYIVYSINSLSPYLIGDSLNYATNAQVILSDNGLGFKRPYGIGVLLSILGRVTGSLVTANKIMAITSFLLTVPASHFLLKRYVSREFAFFGSVGITVVSILHSPIGWGYLTLLGISFMMFSIHATLRLLEEPERKRMLVAGVLYSATVYIHPLAAFYTAVLLGFYLSIHFLYPFIKRREGNPFDEVFHRKENAGKFKYLIGSGITSLILSIPVLFHVYTRLFSLVGASGEANPVNLGIQSSRFIHGTSAYHLLLPLLFTSLPRLDRERAGLVASFILLTAVSFLTPMEEALRRILYAVPFFLGLLVVPELEYWKDYLRKEFEKPDTGEIVLLALMSLLVLNSAMSYSQNLENYYKVNSFDEGYQEDLKWMNQNIPEGTNIITSEKYVGWLIEGYAALDAYEPTRFIFPEQVEKANISRQVLHNLSGRKAVEKMEQENIDYIIIRKGTYNPVTDSLELVLSGERLNIYSRKNNSTAN